MIENPLKFPKIDGTVGTLQATEEYAVGGLERAEPLEGEVFGASGG